MKEKLLKAIDGRTMDSFFKKYIEKECDIKYPTFMNQLDGRSTMRGDVKRVIQDYISKQNK